MEATPAGATATSAASSRAGADLPVGRRFPGARAERVPWGAAVRPSDGVVVDGEYAFNLFVYDADGLDAAGVDREAERLRARIAGLDSETPRRYRALRDGDYRGTRSLRGDIHPGRTDLGIHLAD